MFSDDSVASRSCGCRSAIAATPAAPVWPKSQEEEQRQDNAPMEVPPFPRASHQSPNKLFDCASIETKEEFEIEAAAARRAFWGRRAIPMKSGIVPEKRCSWNLIAECRSVLETKHKQISGLW